MDVILVGDSASNVMAGNTTTLPMTLDQIIYHGCSVMKAVKHALVVVDMPFGTCSGNPYKSLEAAIRIMRETGADTLKIEGGAEIINDIKMIIDAGIPVMGHLGLMPQSINKYGTYTVRAKEQAEEITKTIMKITNKPEAAVSVAIVEVEENEWMKKVYDTEIRPNFEKLFKKPGY